MVDLRVDTAELRAAAGELRSVVESATTIGDHSSRVAALVPSVGAEGAIQAVEEFLSRWVYGLRCIAKQGEHTGRDLTTAAVAYESVEVSLTRAGGGSAAVGSDWSSPAAPEPVPVRWRASTVLVPPMQLSMATHASQLIPGDPDETDRLVKRFLDFGQTAAETRRGLGRVGLGGWVGAAAAATEGELRELNRRLATAGAAFDEAAVALGKYAGVHREARGRGAEALRLYQSAAPASAAAHGAVVVGALAVASVEDPDGTLARAGAILAAAREELEAAAMALARALKEPTEGAPKQPGFLAGLRHAIQSLTEGAFESVVELGPAAVGLVELAARLAPTRALADPDGWKKDNEQFFGSIGSHPGKFFGGFIDLDTWKEDPAKAIGKLLPDLATLGFGMAKEGALRADEAEERLTTVAKGVDRASHTGGLTQRLDQTLADRQLTELGLRTDGPAGSAARAQMRLLRNPDDWMPVRLHDGDLIAVTDHGKIITPVSGELPTDAREFYEPIQAPATRIHVADGVPAPPELPPNVKLFRVHGDIDGAAATASANTQFGAGGGTQLSIGDFDEAIDSGLLTPVGEHTFDPSTLRSSFEDPSYRQVDPTLPERALNPDHERLLGRWDAAKDHAKEMTRDTTVVATNEIATEHAERGER